MRQRRTTSLCLRLGGALALASLGSAASADIPLGQARGREFWAGIVKDCQAPAGTSAAGLVREARGLLGSPESEWRDDVGYGVVASCVYQKRALSAGERRDLVAELSANLRRGMGETGTDSVLRRSFSALDLSVFAALEIEEPVLDEAGYRRLLADALDYLAGERDLRGLDPRLGWIHATAHTADLLKFLARNPRFTGLDQVRVLDAVASKMTGRGTPVFTHAEDERLAAVVVTIARRADFDGALLDPWLARFVALEKEVWARTPPDGATLDAAQNARNLLRCVYVGLCLPPPGGAAPATPSAGESQARERILAALAQIRL